MKLEAILIDGYMINSNLDLVIECKRFIAILNCKSQIGKKNVCYKIWIKKL